MRTTATYSWTLQSPGRTLIGPGDFAYLGNCIVTSGVYSGLPFGSGLAHRYVGDQLRFLVNGYSGNSNTPNPVVEFPFTSLGQNITTRSNLWATPQIKSSGSGAGGLFWDAPNQRLWSSEGGDYTGSTDSHSISTRQLNADGSISSFSGLYGFTNVSMRAVSYGGARPVPTWFQQQYSVGPWSYGFGGYTSLMGSGSPVNAPNSFPSMGLFMVCGPDVNTYPTGTVLPTTDFKILADHRSGNGYLAYTDPAWKTSKDRGARDANVTNYMDVPGGFVDPVNGNNSPLRPTVPPPSNADWLSPAPDGQGRLTWGDAYYNTGNWIEGTSKYGFITVLTCSTGYCWYGGGTLHRDGRTAAIQIFDPHDFGAVAQGTKAPWNVQPVATLDLYSILHPLGLLGVIAGDVCQQGVAAADFDPTTNILWLWCPGFVGAGSNNGMNSRLVAFQVNC